MSASSSCRSLALGGPYDLGSSLLLRDHGRGDPCMLRPGPDELLRACWTEMGPVTYHLRVRSRARALDIQAWGPGAAWLLEAAPTLLGLDALRPELGGEMAEIQRRLPGVHRARAFDPFELLVNYVIRQRVAWRDAVRCQTKLVRAHAPPAPGPGQLRLPLGSEQWGALSTADLAAFGLDRKRARTLLGVASRADRIRSWTGLSSEEFGAKLEAFPGVGPWTRAMVQGLALGDDDAVPLGDYGLPAMISWFFTRVRHADDERMLELLEPYRGRRFLVIHLLWAAGVHAPRRGPRKRGHEPGRAV